MAGENKTGVRTDHHRSTNEVTRAEFNKLVDDVEAIRAALVAHGAVAHGTVNLPAANLTAGKVNP